MFVFKILQLFRLLTWKRPLNLFCIWIFNRHNSQANDNVCVSLQQFGILKYFSLSQSLTVCFLRVYSEGILWIKKMSIYRLPRKEIILFDCVLIFIYAKWKLLNGIMIFIIIFCYILLKMILSGCGPVSVTFVCKNCIFVILSVIFFSVV